MKIKSYHLLFRIFSFLADKTNGVSLFTKYKIILGTLILGLTASSSCVKRTQVVTCYVPAIPPQDSIARVTSYDTVVDENTEDTISTEVKFVPPSISVIEELEDLTTCYMPVITCYDPAIPLDTMRIEEEPKEMTYGSTDIVPEYPNGSLEGFAKWVQSEVQYPEEFREYKVSGRVTARFTIDETGNVTNPIIIRGMNAGIDTSAADAEVIRAILSSPQWTPGQHKGKPISVSIVIPIRFASDMNNKKVEE